MNKLIFYHWMHTIKLKNRIFAKEFVQRTNFTMQTENSIIDTIGEILKQNKQTIAVAESCTGGNIAHRITEIAGVSSFFKGGVVAYCNEIKNRVLNVSNQTLQQYGAVSEHTAKQMAQGVLKLYDTDYAISTTGLAGPDSDGTNTEIGTVFLCFADKKGKTIIKKCCFKTDRMDFINKVTFLALSLVLQNIITTRKNIPISENN